MDRGSTHRTHPETRIGHIHLKVSDLARAIAFYRDVMGFEVQQTFGTQAAFLSAGGYHHHIGLNTWDSQGAAPPPPYHTGLYHVAFLSPIALPWRRRCGLCWPPAWPLMVPPTTAYPRRCISAILMAMASKSTATARPKTGRARPMAAWP